MTSAKKAAVDVAQIRSEFEIWIDHARLEPADAEWLRGVRWLTLWNVTVPQGLLASLPNLQGLDLRGGSAPDLALLDGCVGLRCLVVNQVRRMRDLSVLGTLTSLELLQLYGLKQVTDVPSLGGHAALRRLDLGVMRGLSELNGLLDAPGLEEVFLFKHINVSEADVARIRAHGAMQSFDWVGIDVPAVKWLPVVEEIGLPKTRAVRPMDWFEASGGLR